MRKIALIVLISWAQIVSILLFCVGFFPAKKPPLGYANFDNLERNLKINTNGAIMTIQEQHCFSNLISSFKKPRVEKLIIVVVDALRTDFVLAPSGSPMKFLRSLINNHSALAFSARTQSPTVTMPRIKAITAGTVPAFIDVVLNLMSTEFAEDNWVEQLKRQNRSIVFFGDDTWTKLFPSHFHKVDPTTSFFVSDYTEVDSNVTRNLDWALSSDGNWDVMILHFLGLDHIGHSFGPKSDLVPVKLAEMDRILERMFNFLDSNFITSMMIVLGDHGMSDVGSHGGASLAETGVPITFLSPDWLKYSTRVPKLEGSPAYYPEIEQIDMVPTLATIMGIPIPQNNLGVVIPTVLKRFYGHQSEDEDLLVLLASLSNALQIGQVKSGNYGAKVTISIENTRSRLQNFCQKEIGEKNFNPKMLQENLNELIYRLKEEQQFLMTSFTAYKMDFMIIGTVLSITICVLLLVLTLKQMRESCSNEKSALISKFMVFGCLMHTVSYGSSSFVEEEHQTWYFLWTSLLLLIFLNQSRLSWIHRKNSGIFSSGKFSVVISKFGIVILLAFHKILRAWNQTGVKWSHLPDIGDWLNGPRFSVWKAVFVLSSSLVIVFISTSMIRKPVSRLIFIVGYGLALWFHAIRGNFEVPGFSLLLHRGLLQARLVYAAAIVLCFVERKLSKPSILLILCLLIKAHNFPVLAGILICGKVLQGAMEICKNYEVIGSILICWFMEVCYFYLGNSNSLGTVDVSVGYVGLDGYFPVPVGCLMIIYLYTGPTIVMLAENSQMENLDWLIVLLARALPTSVYLVIVIVERYHLFVWSVFAPKLLYETVHTVVFNSAISVAILSGKIKK